MLCDDLPCLRAVLNDLLLKTLRQQLHVLRYLGKQTHSYTKLCLWISFVALGVGDFNEDKITPPCTSGFGNVKVIFLNY